jgi:hypothetical protein
VKLFYMLTGRETEADIEELAGFVKWMKQIRQSSVSLPRIVFSFGYMVRMPFTPLRYDPPVLQEGAWRETGGRVKSVCETNGFEFRLSMTWPEYAATQALAGAGPSLHSLLEEMAAGGCVTDKGLSAPARHSLERWLEKNAVAIAGEKPPGFEFPFGFLDDEDSRRFLYRQYERAKQGLDAGYAGAQSTHRGDPREGLAREARALGELMARKRRLKPVYMAVLLPRETAGMGTPWIDAWLMREYLARHPEETDNILSVSVPFAAGTALGADELPWFGKTVAAVIAWDTSRLSSMAFDPRAVKSVSVRVELPADLFADPAQRLADFLRDAHAPVTVSRASFQVGEKALKKKMLLAGTCRTKGAGAVVELTIGPRPFLREWLESFGDTRSARRAIVEILAQE